MRNAKNDTVVILLKVNKSITLNLQNYQSLRLGVDDADSFTDADQVLIMEIQRLGLRVDDRIKRVLMWQDE